jgi:1-acyl-sn-glycerol-3-phosphate acyltransferase
MMRENIETASLELRPAGRVASLVILMSNHASLYDIPLIFFVLPGSIRMLTKKALFAIPIWGRGLGGARRNAVP